MFGAWNNIAKSAEAVVSRWAVKRVFKFLLKKKLGQFILGDIDLDQLDVQLAEGTIHLSDLALNVDYLNQKIGPAASLVIKEGSIGSLLVKMPWKGKGCQVEVDELELLLAPCMENDHLSRADEHCSSNNDGNYYNCSDLGKFSNEMEGSPRNPENVHEGVKTIAKMVKWFLTSFNVKIKRLIVAFDPSLENVEKLGFHRTFVLRISETECGTCVSEDAGLGGEGRAHSFLGISQLTNFVKFHGAALELLQMEDVDDQSCASHASGMPFSGLYSYCSPPNAAIPIMSGKGGGFSGNLKLSIPWKNGSLDIRKVDADVSIDPVDLRFQPSIIKWLLLSWETFKNFDKVGKNSMHCETTDSVYLNSNSQFQSSASAMTVSDKVTKNQGRFSAGCTSLNVRESVDETGLPGSHFIPNWVPISVGKNKQDVGEEVDFGASVDQFFECFDGMRNSQSALGSSGMWNWTCSVFSAITAASSLASGSLQIPSEQQHAQTNLKASFAGIFIVLSFHDENLDHLCDLVHASSSIHYLGIECRDISVLVQVCPQEMRFEGTMVHIEAADYFCRKDGGDCGNNVDSKTFSIKNMQDEVQHALPLFSPSTGDRSPDVFGELVSTDFSLRDEGDMVKIMLFTTSGVTHCQCTVRSSSSGGSFSGQTSFSLKLPPLTFWFSFSLLKMLSDLLKEVGKSTEMGNNKRKVSYDASYEKFESSHSHVKIISGSCITNSSSAEMLRGNISISNARIILCFPFKSDEDDGGYPSWDQFIVLDLSSPLPSKGEMQDSSPHLDGSLQKQFPSSGTRSLHLNFVYLSLYSVITAQKDGSGIDYGSIQRHKFSSQKILSVSNRTGCLSFISVFWQEGHVTGPWIAEKAKFLATPEESRSGNKSMGKGYEFATVTTVKDLDDISAQTRQEIIFSTTCFAHIHLSSVMVDLDSLQYIGLHNLLKQIITGLSCFSCDVTGTKEEDSISQTSVLLECDSVEISVKPDDEENVKAPMRSELPGSWGCLKLNIQKFDLLSVSNVGDIRGSSFLWLTHSEGTLSGSVSGDQDQEFLLISCSDSAMKRGDGGGSNALSSRLAGSDIVNFWEPESFQDFTSITVRCCTIVAVGGRLDWMGVICSFFSLPSVDPEQFVEHNLPNGDLDKPAHRSSFVLKLVDIGLSYEPQLNNLAVHSEVLDSDSVSSDAKDDTSEPYVACLIAASSFCLSNSTVADSLGNEFRIRLQDLGFLLRAVSECDKLGGTYSAEQLNRGGYVKVAREALIEAVVKTSCANGLLWTVECSNSQIYVETCHDTTSGLIRLAAQLQQLFAPDVEESIVHLQTRWNNFQMEQQRNDEKNRAPSTSEIHTVTAELEAKCGVAGLMDEISEDAFSLDGNETFQIGSSEVQFHLPVKENVAEEPCSLSFENAEMFSHELPVNGIGLQSSQASFLEQGYFPELIESYCLPELRPLTELPTGLKSSHEVLKCRSLHVGEGDLGRGNSGWYEDASLKIVENHISEPSGRAGLKSFVEDRLLYHDSGEPDDTVNIIGRVLLKNINIRWRMYAGSDWRKAIMSNMQSSNILGRDRTVCLELAVSRMEFHYDIFTPGGVSVSKLSLSVHDFHLYDKSTDAPWKLVLRYYDSKDHPRESYSKAFKLDLEAVRPDPFTPLEEYRLRVALLPMRLHLHQSQLDFLVRFFGEKSSSLNQSTSCPPDSDLLVMRSHYLAGHAIADEALLPYFQKFDIWPILVRVDYSPQHVDLAALKGGKYAELVNIVPWKGVELELKHVHAIGVYGWGSVCETIIGQWLEDISQNQIHKVLCGLPTIPSLVSVGAAAAKLVSLPLESYRKDQRVLKGMQRGTMAFLRSISLEAVRLGVHLAAGTRDFLLQTEYMLTNSPPVSRPSQGKTKTKTNVRHNQPKDSQQGIQQAYQSFSNGLGRSASALVQTPLKKYQRGASASSALATAVKAVPTAAIAPASGCASAIHSTLLGIRNSLDPELKKEAMQKYFGPTLPQDPN
ncbi:autophagy-related protein 2-like [Hibiscus syriacus]|uniref:autophagy-related protein 2-like n=1 Tax=Hibiscus syriacus TaxID=106335 RepID=UPI001921B200|nr:autophagy-related protein 2-like [Hibiscus syriacus]XP_039063002.1 autophagy-related protein 2-like [Hibiscus syriacus]XP_039063003.1 autophagy-related protein 2-like [Hibiscus syriacus]